MICRAQISCENTYEKYYRRYLAKFNWLFYNSNAKDVDFWKLAYEIHLKINWMEKRFLKCGPHCGSIPGIIEKMSRMFWILAEQIRTNSCYTQVIF